MVELRTQVKAVEAKMRALGLQLPADGAQQQQQYDGALLATTPPSAAVAARVSLSSPPSVHILQGQHSRAHSVKVASRPPSVNKEPATSGQTHNSFLHPALACPSGAQSQRRLLAFSSSSSTVELAVQEPTGSSRAPSSSLSAQPASPGQPLRLHMSSSLAGMSSGSGNNPLPPRASSLRQLSTGVAAHNSSNSRPLQFTVVTAAHSSGSSSSSSSMLLMPQLQVPGASAAAAAEFDSDAAAVATPVLS